MQPLFARPLDVTADDLWLMCWEACETVKATCGVIQPVAVMDVDSGILVHYTDFRDMGFKAMTLSLVPGSESPVLWFGNDAGSERLTLTSLQTLDHPAWEVRSSRRALDSQLADLARRACTPILAGLYHQARLNWQREEDEAVLKALCHVATIHRERGESVQLEEVVGVMLAIAQQLWTEGQPVQAAGFYKAALLDFPDAGYDALETVVHAESLAACGEWVSAIKVIQASLGSIEHNEGGRLAEGRLRQLRMVLPMRMAAIFRAVGDLEGAMIALQESLDVAYEDAQHIAGEHIKLALGELAGVFEERGAWQEAVACYERLQLLVPTEAHLARIRELRHRLATGNGGR